MTVYRIRRPQAQDWLCQVVAQDSKRALATARSMFPLPKGTIATPIRPWLDPNRNPTLNLTHP